MQEEQEIQLNYNYYIGTEKDCLDYNEEVKAKLSFSESTTDWASVMKHPDDLIYAIKKEPSVYTLIEGLTGVMELDSSWNKEVILYQ